MRRSLDRYFKKGIKITDSQVVLHWLNNKDLPLNTWVRNRVIEILRFTDKDNWWYTDSSSMIVDIATRKGFTIDDIKTGSKWSSGYDWMNKDISEFPVKNVTEIRLETSEMESCKAELLSEKYQKCHLSCVTGVAAQAHMTQDTGDGHAVPNEVISYYEFSSYLIDPNRYRYSKVVRILAIVKRFIRKVITKYQERKGIPLTYPHSIGYNHSIFSEQEIADAQNYFYAIATREIKQFVDLKEVKKISAEKQNILYYTGRILPVQRVESVVQLSDVMTDLCATTFCVPLISKHSPIAYSIVNEVHWFHPVAMHAGVETVLRYTMEYAFILSGRDLVKRFKNKCVRCRYLCKKAVEVSMGPVSAYNIRIAPAFYFTQVDIAGPFTAYSNHNKRASIKVWYVVFCCATTTTISVKVMEDYSSSSFIKAFIRFACEVGYPKELLPDEGSQLIKGCDSMKLKFKDIEGKLYTNYKVEFKPCPVGGHNMHSRVERKIRQIKESLMKTMQHERVSVIEWETLGSQIANSINDLPIGFRNVSSDLENIDLITPNRLRLGRNNQRSPIGVVEVTCNPVKFLRSNELIFNAWFNNWLISHVPHLMHQTKWFTDDQELKEGDVVLFLKTEGKVTGEYQYGMVQSVARGSDGRVRKAVLKYRNQNENADRETNRAVRQIIMLHPIDELGITQELGKIAAAVDAKICLTSDI